MTYRTSLLLTLLLGATVAGAAHARQPADEAGRSVAAPVIDVRRVKPVVGDAQAGAGKAAVCAACHGPQGFAIAPTFPDLAGQSATYTYLQLKEFKDGQRSDPVMAAQTAALSDEDMRDLASYYASLTPKPAGQADASSLGANLYREGDPARGIPSCQGCHGPAGNGPQPQVVSVTSPPWASYPRLHGQGAMYLTKQLGDYRSGARAGSTNAKVMHGVVQSLTDDDIQALASYLSTL